MDRLKTCRLKAVAVLLCLVAALALSRAAVAEDWPTRPVTLIVPFAPGGTTDIVARIVGQALSVRLGQSVIVENLGGAGGTLGANQAAKAAPDGYTIFMATIAHTMAPGIYKSLPYDFVKDFAPITVVAYVPNIVIVHPSVPAKTVGELLAYIRANPGKVNYGSAGIGSTEHMSGELLSAMAGLKMVHVPYKGGAPMMADLIAGHIEMSIETSGSASAAHQGGKRAGACREHGQAIAGIPRSADARRSRAHRLRRDDLVRHSRADRHAGGHS